MDAVTLNRQLLEAAQFLRNALEELDTQTVKYAQAERAYRLAKATAILAVGGTVLEREAHADQATADLRYARDLAEGLKVSALEAVRSRRAMLSATQTVANLYREEASFDRTGPSNEQPQWGASRTGADVG